MASEKTIVLVGNGRTFEGECGAAASPGMAVELQADGFYDPVVSAQAAALKKSLVIVREDALQGKTVDETAGAYAVGDPMQLYVPQSGDEILVLLKDGETIAVGDDIVLEGASGLFVEAAGTEAKFSAVALEALSPSGNNALLAVRVH